MLLQDYHPVFINNSFTVTIKQYNIIEFHSISAVGITPQH